MRKSLLIALFTIATLAAATQVEVDSLYRRLEAAPADGKRNSLPNRRVQVDADHVMARSQWEANDNPAAIERYRQTIVRAAVIGGGLFLLLIGGALFGLFHYRRQCRVAHLERERSADLRRINQLKTQFLANTSHELRTPLQGIIGLAEGLLERTEEPQHRKHLSLIVAGGHRLNNMVSDILAFSRLRHANIELQRTAVDLRGLTELVLDLCRPLASSKTLRLINSVPEDLPPVHGDENRLQQILFNLVGNAIKFTERGHVKVSARPESDEYIRIWVEDTGIGIPNDKQQLIFEPFEQVDASASRHHTGGGLGLSIARELVELHGGQLWVHSAGGLGSIFYFTLPIAAGLRPRPRTYYCRRRSGQPGGPEKPPGGQSLSPHHRP